LTKIKMTKVFTQKPKLFNHSDVGLGDQKRDI
jgi:hypothetical protein